MMKNVLIILTILTLSACATGEYSQVNIGNGKCYIEEKGE